MVKFAGASLALCSLSLVANAAVNISFNPSAAGTAGKNIDNYTLDVKNLRTDSAYQADIASAGGAGEFDTVRVAWYPQVALSSTNLGNAQLLQEAKDYLDDQKAKATNLRATPNYFLSPKLGFGGYDAYYLNSSTGKIVVDRWVKAMERSRDYYGTTRVDYNGATNEPDNGSKFSATIFNQIRDAMTGWSATQVGPCAYNASTATAWMPTIQNRIGKASTHAIGGTTMSQYKAFNTAANNAGKDRWNSELHNLSEAITGAELGFTRGCWWAAINDARGKFMRYSKNNRISYQEFGTFGSAAGYKGNIAKEVFLFVAQTQAAAATTINYTSSFPVRFDGSALKTTHSVSLGSDDEKVIRVTW